MKNRKNLAKSLVVIAFIAVSGQISAQNQLSMPYSRFGIGDLFTNNGVYSMSMGGIAYGTYSPYFVNPANPASYAAFDSLSFIFDISVHSRQSKLITKDMSQSANYTSLGNLLFGFPLARWWKTSFGILPYSQVGYNIIDSQVDALAGNVDYLYHGDGGINQVYIGNSLSITRNLSAGFNFSYLFGTINKYSAVEFPDSLFKLFYKENTASQVHDVYLNYGLFYHTLAKNGMQYNAGFAFSNSSRINVSENRLGYTYFKSSSGVDLVRDTVLNDNEVKGTMLIPTNIGFGFSLGRNEKWMAGADIQWQQWEKFTYFDVNDSLKNSLRISIGGSYNPSSSTISGYWQRITYRGGLRFTNSYLDLRGQNVNEFGISLGVGLPLPRTRSTINFAAEFGTRGTISNNLIKENFVKFTLGLSIFERWFIVRKYD